MIIINLIQAHRSSGFRSGIDQAISAIETDFYTMALLVLFAFIPFFPLELNLLRYEPPSQTYVSVDVPAQITVENDPTQYSTTLNPKVQTAISVYGTPKVPVLMYLVMRASYGLNYALSKGILDSSDRGDLQSAKYAMSKFTLSDPDVSSQFRQFGSDCFEAARTRFITWSQAGILRDRLPPAAITALEDNPDDINYFSSEVFQLTPGLYAVCPDEGTCNRNLRASQNIMGFPYNAARDGVRLAEEEGQPGRPGCLEWWQSLRQDINSSNPDARTVFDKVQDVFGTFGDRDEDILAERILKNTFEESSNLGGQSYGAFNDTDKGLFKSIASGISALRLSAANQIAAFDNFPVRESVTIVLSVLLMLIIVYYPVIIFFRGFRWPAFVQVAGLTFAIITAHSTLTLVSFAETALYDAIFGDNNILVSLTSIGQQSFKFTFNIIYPVMVTLHLGIFGLISTQVSQLGFGASAASSGSLNQGGLAKTTSAANTLGRGAGQAKDKASSASSWAKSKI